MSSLSDSDTQSTTAPVAAKAAEAAAPPPPAPTAPAVRVQDVSITYRTTFERTPTFKSAIVRLGRGERAVREVQALKHVTFDVPEGTSLGIVGANGAGKSTLMRAIGGILPPTEGRIEVHGRISTLLALGVGFNANLSGARERHPRRPRDRPVPQARSQERAQEIADFAELGDFMDLPMRTYSSGMFSRLAFAVAVHMDPDILMIDEALSAGDAKFKKKAADKMHELMHSARAMFLVSHALGSIKEMCNDGDLAAQGRAHAAAAAPTRWSPPTPSSSRSARTPSASKTCDRSAGAP